MDVTLSLATLWEYLQGKPTSNGYSVDMTLILPNKLPSGVTDQWPEEWPCISDEILGTAYFDLRDNAGQYLCMDGEPCTLIEMDTENVHLRNTQGKQSVDFILSLDEYNIATFVEEKTNQYPA